MATHIVFNGIQISDVLTEDIQVEPVKDATNVDQIGVRYSVSGTGIIHCGEGKHTGLKGSSSLLAYSLDAALARLSKDRRPFRYVINGVTKFDIKPGAVEPGTSATAVTGQLDKMDIAHGPKCSVTVMKIVVGYSATIRFRVEFTIPNIAEQPNRSPLSRSGLLSLRYWISEDIELGGSCLTTRTYQGVLRVLHKGISPHAIARAAAIPPLQSGFKRRVVNLAESEDGLSLSFTFQDVEVVAAAPWSRTGNFGATEWSGNWSLSTSSPNISTISEIQLSLHGPKTTSKQQLLFLAMRVVEFKTHALSLFSGGPVASSTLNGAAFLEQFAVREELAENKISVACRIRHTANQEQLLRLFAPGGSLNFGPPDSMGIGYDPQKSFPAGQTATLSGLFVSALQMPSQPASMPRMSPTAKKDLETVPSAGQNQPQPSAGSLGSAATAVSTAHVAAQYLDYSIHSELFVNTGKVALANGAAKDSNAPSLSIVNLFRPTALRRVTLDASRIDQPPVLPDFRKDFSDSNGINHRAIGEALVGADAPQLSADDRRLLYRVNMRMDYALDRPPTANETISLGSVPYRASSYSDPTRRLPSGIFVPPQNIIS